MTVTIRLDAETTHRLDEVVARVDRTTVWVASEAITFAARSMPAPVLATYLGRRAHTHHKKLLEFDEATLDIIDGLRHAHGTESRQPSRHAIARATILYLLDARGGVDGAVEYLGESRPSQTGRAV